MLKEAGDADHFAKKPDFSHLSDPEIWEKFKNGDNKAFDYIFDTYIKFLYNYGDRMTPDTALVEDCVQELFIELWEKKQNSVLPPTSSIIFWYPYGVKLCVSFGICL